MNKPTNFRVDESLEVVWDVIHEWEEHFEPYAEEKRHDVDDVKTAMAWLMDELGYDFDQSGRIVPVQQ